MIYFGEGLGETWMRDNSAYHEAQRRHPLCGSRVVITDRDSAEYGRKGTITKVTESSPEFKITLKAWDSGEEYIYADRWQFRIIDK